MELCVSNTQMMLSSISFHPSAVDAVPSLEHCLDAVLGWMRDNRLRLNPDKVEVLWVGAPNVCHLGTPFSFGGATLPTKDELPILGILLDPVLSMTSQVASVV